jgi:hypothetical protein
MAALSRRLVVVVVVVIDLTHAQRLAAEPASPLTGSAPYAIASDERAHLKADAWISN